MTCRRSGECCRNADRDLWQTADLLEKEKRLLLLERSKYSDNGCLMMIVENGLATCLIHKLLGKDKKPEICRVFGENLTECPYKKESNDEQEEH